MTAIMLKIWYNETEEKRQKEAMNMSNRIITIEREYASGGREVGELVAKQLGIPFYNREILEMASERCGVSVDYLASAEEAAPKSFLYTLMLSSNPTRSIQENLPLSDKVYIIETNIIKELAEKSDCVIVGRCASYILRDMEHMLSAFIYADSESRVNRAVSEYSVDPRRAEATLRKSDRRRETFYSINTGGNWYDKENYTLCLNSGALGIPLCADIIVSAAQKTIYG